MSLALTSRPVALSRYVTLAYASCHSTDGCDGRDDGRLERVGQPSGSVVGGQFQRRGLFPCAAVSPPFALLYPVNLGGYTTSDEGKQSSLRHKVKHDKHKNINVGLIRFGC